MRMNTNSWDRRTDDNLKARYSSNLYS